MSVPKSLRGRAFAVVSAVAATIVCGSVMTASASVSSGERAVYVPITPCRVMDTRPAPFTVPTGGRATPMSADETYTIKVSGPGTSCAVPVDASAVAMNVTIANPNAASYLTVFPAGVTVPLASSLNWTGGQAPTPNAVTSDIGDGGQVSFYNKFGSVDVLADIVGYFVDHNHDDRYFTKTEINSKVAPGTLVLGPGAFAAGSNSGVTYSIDPSGGSINSVASALCFQAQASLPNGAVVTALRLDAFDSNANPMADVSAVMVVDPIGPAVPTQMASTTSAGINGTVAVSDVTIQSPGIDNTTRAYSVRMCMGSGMFFYDARIDYTTT